jgi:hypothetical protein
MTDPGTYAGIGARATPGEILGLMSQLAHRLGTLGWTLRSGGAPGADQAFMSGADRAGAPSEVYLPWPGYEGIAEPHLHRASPGALDLAAKFHPAWSTCKPGVRALHARNCHQVLGRALDSPATFVICWTPDGSLTGETRASGGTGQALRIAAAHAVPVLNLARADHRRRAHEFLLAA